MNVALPLTAFLAVVVALLIRSRELKIWHVILVGVFGFFLAQTHLADPIGDAVRWLVTGLTHSGDPSAPSTPTAPPTTPPPWQWNA
ncbi:hypothetical protein SAMN05216371_5702 [Streptomyces sp. TLI_053]|uniref:hypothetical protein n=1 Tax=Streptomyces sp. TLI_053 TaxID=1855352 RepID=UPI000879205A|nr:hypothetical protein [Streptomyces sp. TLI_053]SDT78356.1 hypothetical protein SAMN05216371_5702 [Streptomyces sp. TLI_053]